MPYPTYDSDLTYMNSIKPSVDWYKERDYFYLGELSLKESRKQKLNKLK